MGRCPQVPAFRFAKSPTMALDTSEKSSSKRKLPLCTFFREGKCRHLNDCRFPHVSCREGGNCKDKNCEFGHVTNRESSASPSKTSKHNNIDETHTHPAAKKKFKLKPTQASPPETPTPRPRPGAARRARIRKRLAARDEARAKKETAQRKCAILKRSSSMGWILQ